MILKNINIIEQHGPRHLRFAGNKIETITSNDELLKPGKDETSIIFNQAVAFPGLFNSHDHLEFNLFPNLAHGPYKNYMEWGSDIHKKNKDIINSVLQIPKHLRVEWGIYKNLLNGVTTVVQHGERFELKDPLINVFQGCYSLHSVGLEKKWKYKLNRPIAKKQPYVIHIGEGTDIKASHEINELIKWNLFKRKLIAVHGVAMNTKQARSFEALVWCPDSNFFLLNATAKVDNLKKKTKILFGTDSTLSASWNIWEQLRLSRNTNMLTDKEIFKALTCLPATVWNLQNMGILSEGKNADIVVANMKDKHDSMNSFFALNPEDILMVIRNGEIVLFDEILCVQLNRNINIHGFSKIFIRNVCKYVWGDLVGLLKEIKRFSVNVKFPIEIG